MAGITLVPQFADSHGVLHPTVEAAVSAERRIMVSDMVVIERDRFGLTFAEVDATVDLLVTAHPKVAEIMAVDLQRGLHNNGLVERAGTSHFGQRLAETIQSRPAVPPAKRTKDADNRVLFVGDSAHMIGTEPDSREKWGPEPTKRIADIREDGTMTFVGDTQWVWHPSAIRRGDAPKAA